MTSVQLHRHGRPERPAERPVNRDERKPRRGPHVAGQQNKRKGASLPHLKSSSDDSTILDCQQRPMAIMIKLGLLARKSLELAMAAGSDAGAHPWAAPATSPTVV